ncbi:cyclic pyranopterin monophosphate synthase MoaC [Collinsella sp. D33t1_170424_A12]|uniref:cyclic pyranopterin monophosphate synthase MoaC n=1 Tax=Collinsella sp. D33t1_170424_A12 TaxID=2787135 RepID=UPI00189B51D9|nr:cyclic pyranopterin monophosphate synthase MoaC [Collinsella sp. D33t1_170424_A12]
MADAASRDAYRDELTHVDERGDVRMVDVSQKEATQRTAVAEASILMHPETQAMVLEDRAKKGDVLACARVAGIMASKRASDLIPMCHPLNITKSKVEIEPIPAQGPGARADGRVGFHVLATCGITGVTGIEMEALTAASVAALTIYDMCKAVDRGMEIVDTRLLLKEGGRSGTWARVPEAPEDDARSCVDGGSLSCVFAAVDDESAAHALAPAPVVAFIGYQNSGKTTLVEKVIAELSARGMRVGSIKHHGHHGFDIDVPGKDSWRHAQAGSRHVGLICANRYAEYADTDNELPLDVLLDRFVDVDIVIVEGYKAAGLANVVVARSGVDRLRGQSSLDLVGEGTLALACNDALANRVRLDQPVVDINDAGAVADVVEAHWRRERSNV